MQAIFKTGGKQYRVVEGDVIDIEKLEGEAGDKVTFDEVLMAGSGDSMKFGEPTLAGASVEGEVVHQFRTRKVLVFKKRRRKNSRRLNGHRQQLTKVKITAIKA